MTNSQSMLPCNTFAYWNTENLCPEFVHTFINTDGHEDHANYFSDKSPNELRDIQGLVPIGEVYRVCS
jgi:hypothetical protein